MPAPSPQPRSPLRTHTARVKTKPPVNQLRPGHREGLDDETKTSDFPVEGGNPSVSGSEGGWRAEARVPPPRRLRERLAWIWNLELLETQLNWSPGERVSGWGRGWGLPPVDQGRI